MACATGIAELSGRRTERGPRVAPRRLGWPMRSKTCTSLSTSATTPRCSAAGRRRIGLGVILLGIAVVGFIVEYQDYRVLKEAPEVLTFEEAVRQRRSYGRQRAAQRRGLGSARDKLHGRVVKRRSVVEMAPPVTRNTAVNGRATGPDPRRKQACARSPRTAHGSRTRTSIL